MSPVLQQSQIIAAVKDKAALSAACRLSLPAAFLLFGNITDLSKNVRVLKENGKNVFVHIDLIDGLRPDWEGIRYVAERVGADGVLSTKPAAVKQAREFGLKTVFRIFMIDASAFDTGVQAVKTCGPDAVEVMPGLVYDVIAELAKSIRMPIIAGGMVKTAGQAGQALASGAQAVSTSSTDIWRLFP